MSATGIRQRIATLTIELAYPDGQTVRLDGTDLLADAAITLPDYPAIDAQDIYPLAIMPRPATHFTLDVTLDLKSHLTMRHSPAASAETPAP